MQKLESNSIKFILLFILSITLLFVMNKINIGIEWLSVITILALIVLLCCIIANLILITLYKSELRSKILALTLSVIPLVISLYYFSLMLRSIRC